MYYKLFNKITDIIAELEQVQKQTEDMFIEDSLVKKRKLRSSYDLREDR